jgi:hypothetical protein
LWMQLVACGICSSSASAVALYRPARTLFS